MEIAKIVYELSILMDDILKSYSNDAHLLEAYTPSEYSAKKKDWLNKIDEILRALE